MKIIIKGEISQPLSEYDYEELIIHLSEIGIYEVKIKTEGKASELDYTDQETMMLAT